jgi:hypothetical protein
MSAPPSADVREGRYGQTDPLGQRQMWMLSRGPFSPAGMQLTAVTYVTSVLPGQATGEPVPRTW